LRKLLSADRRADAGVGMTVLFITVILTATGAASVVIDQTSEVQSQANTTAMDALVDVSKGLWVLQILGHASNGEMDSVEVYVKLQPGSPDVAMGDVMLLLFYDDVRLDLMLNDTQASSSGYRCELALARSDVGQDWEDFHVLGYMDVARITITDDDGHLGLEAREEVTMMFLPASGLGLEYGFTVPLICQDGWFTIR